MKKYVTLTLFLLLTFMGCQLSPNTKKNAPAFISSKTMDIEFQFPEGWYVNPKKNPYDLQCFSAQKDLNTGIFFNKRINLAKDITAESLLELQVDDLRGKRSNFELVEALTETKFADKRILSVVYAGDKGASRFYYKLSCIEFSAAPNDLAIVIQISFPSDWSMNKGIFRKICESARYKTEKQK